jgi:hypothetical protein
MFLEREREGNGERGRERGKVTEEEGDRGWMNCLGYGSQEAVVDASRF